MRRFRVALILAALQPFFGGVAAGQQDAVVPAQPRLRMQAGGAAPTGVFGVAQGSAVHLSWNCVSGSIRYEIMVMLASQPARRIGTAGATCARGMDPRTLAALQQARAEGRLPPAPAPSSIELPLSNSYTHTNAPLGTRVTYVIRAVQADRYGDSDPIDVVTPLPAPRALAANVVGTDGAELRWEAVPGATGYRVRRTNVQLQSFDAPVTPNCIGETSHVDRGLEPARYIYSVAACPDGVQATTSLTIAARRTATAPTGPISGSPALIMGGGTTTAPKEPANRAQGSFAEVRTEINAIGESLSSPDGGFIARIVSGPRPYLVRFERTSGRHAADVGFYIGPTSDMGGAAFCSNDAAALVVSGNGQALGSSADHVFTVVGLTSTPARVRTLSAQASKPNGFFTPRVFFSPDCTLVLTAIANLGGSSNYVLEVWDVASGRKIGSDVELHEFNADFSAAVITVDGRSYVEIRTDQRSVRFPI